MNNSTSRIAIAGTVTPTGTISTGTGFYPELIGLGHYRVSFAQRLNSLPIVLVTLNAGRDNMWTGAVTLHNVQQSSFEVSIHDLGTQYCNIGFCFAVIV